MLTVVQSPEFSKWFGGLRDRRAQGRIASRLFRLENENFGDVKPIGEGLSEMRVDVGPGYRIYMMHRDRHVIVLLCGGDKSSQRRDIARAKQIAAEWKE